MVATRALVMPRRKRGEPKRDDVPVKIDREAYRLAKSVASFRGLHLNEYLSKIILPIVIKEFDELPKERRSAQ